MKVDEITYCDKCENRIEERINEDRALDLHLTGGYGMFMDVDTIHIILCHSCAVELFRSIPSLSSDKINGLHSVFYDSKDYPLCCEYAWAIDNESNERDEHGQRSAIFGTKEHFDKKENS